MAALLALKYIFIRMKSSHRIALSSFIVLVITLFSYSDQLESPLRQLLAYQTSSSRMVLTNNLCANSPRWSTPPSDTLSLNKEYLAHLNATIPVNGNHLFNKMFDNLSEAPNLMIQQAKGFGLWIGPFLLAFVLTLFIWPFLACCCCCPGCCPPSCCRQKDGDLYSKCQMRWPAVILSLTLMLAISSGAYGFTKANVMSQSIVKLGCAGSMIADDLLNGNVTSDGSSYFTGLNMLNIQLGWFSGNMSTITTQLNNFDSANTNVTSALSLGNTLLTDIKSIDGNSGSGMTAISYVAPIGANSLFPGLLATASTPGLLLDYYQGPQIVIAKLQGIANNVHSFLQAGSGIAGNVSSVQSLLRTPIQTINDYDKKDYIDTMNVYAGYGTLGYQALYAAIMGLSALALLGTWMMCCCSKDRCRYLVYLSCFFMFFLVIVTTLITTIFSALMPPFAWSCEYINASFNDKFEFDYNFRGLPAEMRDYVSTCMSYGSGNLIGKFNMDSLNTLTNLTSAFSVLSTFDIPTINTQLTSNHSNFLTIIDNYGRSKKSDLANLDPLIKVANHNNYSSCLDSNFVQDSYVPSISQITTYVACTTTGNAGIAACSGNFNPKGGSCIGCLDVAQIFNANATAADVKAAVWGRYANVLSCEPFAIDLSNLWVNYYYVKQQKIGNSINTVVGSVYEKASTLTTSINNFKASLTTLSTAQASVNTSLSSLNNLLDPQYGMLGGLNCRVFGQDVQRVISTACVDTFNSFFIVRLALGISSLAMFFSLCCAVCAGSRHFRQSNCRSSKVENSSQDVQEKDRPHKAEDTLETLRPR